MGPDKQSRINNEWAEFRIRKVFALCKRSQLNDKAMTSQAQPLYSDS